MTKTTQINKVNKINGSYAIAYAIVYAIKYTSVMQLDMLNICFIVYMFKCLNVLSFNFLTFNY
jgi:hypothetical protein